MNKIYLSISFILILTISTSVAYTRGHRTGYQIAQDEYKKIYNEALTKSLDEQKNKLKEEFDLIKENWFKEKEIKVIYKDRVVEVEKLIKDENLKSCLINDEQVKKINELTKR